jgi:ribosomal protein S18 acetylase RimI-like enzyme
MMDMSNGLIIVPARAKDLLEVKSLFSEYASSLGIDLSFQDFDRELAALPGDYAPPNGCILIARKESEAVGCVAMRKISNETCEMKRLYVRPGFRGKGVGNSLALSVIQEAKRKGYHKMRLDTLSSMIEALALYESLGFKQIAAYRHNPIQGAIFLELDLTVV